ncbi:MULTISPECIES: ClbS/DfsB family four-helix bundle protein [unclassified Gilliamella]|uniref:ClbS/DfsB family four-helix bundle protein n=1 Tax=unclassified Gilliamella TaxID=2685620 RepID=UPI001C6954C9|nr:MULTISPECIES: ClbS/DfsB family four-helix bundle protein [unclassified Gilliamella]MCX8660299.1 ClbS/DfsB family four-helix bundle protein [Gilliamella sp. B2772]MCX8683141.1 ClbS/DfsB family four-helix bundle protein [Gilliamella sp. B2889]QYN42791.1 ClbS/DfsB family four-helix bundle protein [Gilliamella sp. ESL0443]
MNYENKQHLLDEINKTAKLFIDEFSELSELDKDKLIDGVDRTPSQMIAYQLGWLDLVKSWDDLELAGQTPTLPAEGYKWNQLGTLYQHFYKIYQDYSLQELIKLFNEKLVIWNNWINSLDDSTLFIKDTRNWTKPFPSAWTVARFIHINSVAPFKSFRAKIRKWKKLNSNQ